MILPLVVLAAAFALESLSYGGQSHAGTLQQQVSKRPAFNYSWGKIPVYAFPGGLRDRNFTDAEIAHYSKFNLLLFWGVDLQRDATRYGPHWFVPDQEAKSLAQAAKFKAANPNLLLFPYITGFLAQNSFKAQAAFNQPQHANWWLRDPVSGEPLDCNETSDTSGGHGTCFGWTQGFPGKLYDWRIPAVRSYWIEQVIAPYVESPLIAGIFMDDTTDVAAWCLEPPHGYICTGNWTFTKTEQLEFLNATLWHLGEALDSMASRGKTAIVSTKARKDSKPLNSSVFDHLLRRHGGMHFIESFSGSEEDVQTALNLTRAGTPLMVHCTQPNNHTGPFSQREYCLAAFLIVAGEYSYWGMGNGWGIDSFPWYPEFDRPLGQPMSSATSIGIGLYFRAFEHLNVTLNTALKTAKILWHGLPPIPTPPTPPPTPPPPPPPPPRKECNLTAWNKICPPTPHAPHQCMACCEAHEAQMFEINCIGPNCWPDHCAGKATPGCEGGGDTFYVLDPSWFSGVLGADYSWAVESIPLFESANATLDHVYYFRWRTYKSHIHPTGNAAFPWVVTEFSPNVSWAGAFNTINAQAGAHLSEAGWLRGENGRAVLDSITRFWVQPNGWLPQGSDRKVYHSYYYWYAHALKRNFAKTGNKTALKGVLDAYKAQFYQYATAALPTQSSMVVAIDTNETKCLFNVPGNDAQEDTISGPGCRPLVQSTMFGEAAALGDMFAALGEVDSANEMHAEAERWRERVLLQWNTNLSSFDTIHPPIEPMPPGWELLADRNGTLCNSTRLYQGAQRRIGCTKLCIAHEQCRFFTHNKVMEWCQLWSQCNTSVKPPGGLGTKTLVTWRKPNAHETESEPTLNTSNGAVGWSFSGVRELASLTSPWLFSVVPTTNASAYAHSWDTAFDEDGLGGPNGLRTAEKRHPGYYCDAGCCSWSGPVWPYESSKAISAAINVLNNYPDVTTIDGGRFWDMLFDYTAMHTTKWRVMASRSTFYRNLTQSPVAEYLMDGLGELWVGENGCGDEKWTVQKGLTGPAWTDRATEGYRYNHATFMDLVLSGVVGLQPMHNGSVIVNPLVPATILPWWCADGVELHGKIISVVFDTDGSHYKRGTGLMVMVNGVMAATSPVLKPVTVSL